MKSLSVALLLCVSLFSNGVRAEVASSGLPDSTARSGQIAHTFDQDAALIKATFESELYTLPPYTLGHYGLRMYRQTQDDKYATAIWNDMARVASRLNKFAAEVHTSAQIRQYAEKKISNYRKKTGERSKLRYEVTKTKPEYLYLGIGLLGSMARADEYGLKHREDATLREVIRRYDFTEYATDPAMIRAWAAQLANQVYWLKQLGEQDVVAIMLLDWQGARAVPTVAGQPELFTAVPYGLIPREPRQKPLH